MLLALAVSRSEDVIGISLGISTLEVEKLIYVALCLVIGAAVAHHVR